MGKMWKNVKVKKITRTTIKTITINASRQITKRKVKRFVKGPFNFTTRLERKRQRAKKIHGQSINIGCEEQVKLVASEEVGQNSGGCADTPHKVQLDAIEVIQPNGQAAVKEQFDCDAVVAQGEVAKSIEKGHSDLFQRDTEKSSKPSGAVKMNKERDIFRHGLETVLRAVNERSSSGGHHNNAPSNIQSKLIKQLDTNSNADRPVKAIKGGSKRREETSNGKPSISAELSPSNQPDAAAKSMDCVIDDRDIEMESEEERRSGHSAPVKVPSAPSVDISHPTKPNAEIVSVDCGVVKKEKAVQRRKRYHKSRDQPSTSISLLSSSTSETDSGLKNEVALSNISKRACWKGALQMSGISNFVTYISADKKESCSFVKNQLPKQLSVVGTIPLDTVWRYLEKARHANKQIIAFLFAHKSAAHESFVVLFNYLLSRQRLGVIKTLPSAIKDFYLLPLDGNYGTYAPVLREIMKSNDIKLRNKRKDEFCGILVKK